MSSALIIVDMQKKFYRGFGKTAMDAAQATLRRLLTEFREQGEPVLWVQHESRRMGLLPDSENFGIIESLQPLPDEGRFVKHEGNSFVGTGLESYLRERGIDRLYLGGYAAEACVHSTYRGAERLGFAVFKIRRGTASGLAALIWLFERIGRYKTVDQILSERNPD